MAAKDHTSRSRFAVACGVLSRCVRAEADAGLPAAAAHAQARPATTATATPTASTMLLMPGADVAAPGVIREEAAAAATPSQAAQLKIVYGGGVLVFDDVPADRAAELLRLAARARHGVPVGTAEDVPVARKASLQRFMEKRRDRLAAQAPYGSASRPAVASKGRRQEGDAGACWLGLGIPRGQVR